MKQDPGLRSLVWRGYLNLALFLMIVAIGLTPVLLYPGPRGIKIAMIGCGVLGIACSIWQRLKRSWTWAVAAGSFVWSVVAIIIGGLVGSEGTLEQTLEQVLILLSLGLLFVGIPRMIERNAKQR